LGPGGVLTGLVKRVLAEEGLRSYSVETPADLEVLTEALTGAEAEVSSRRATKGVTERYVMTERLIVSPANGPFTPAEGFGAAALRLVTSNEPQMARDPLRVDVGDLVGHAGKAEIRSAFAGTLEGLLVLSGERVMTGQPVAWLRAEPDQEGSEGH
jgi:biotin carboxyl carrier protein